MALNPMCRPHVSLLETQQAFAPSPAVLEAAVRRAMASGRTADVVRVVADTGMRAAVSAPTSFDHRGALLKVAMGIAGSAAAAYALYRVWNRGDTKPADGTADGIATQPAIRAASDADGHTPSVTVLDGGDGIRLVSLSQDPSATAAALAGAMMPPLSEAARLAANLRSLDPAIHNRAADDARKFRGRADALLPLLREILDDASLPWSTHKAALEALCNLGEDAAPATESILKAMYHPDARVREVIPSVFEAMGDKAAPALPRLRQMLENQEGSWALRLTILHSLWLMRAAVPDAMMLAPLALHDPHPHVVEEAASLLRQLSLPELRRLLLSDDDDTKIRWMRLLPLLIQPFVGALLRELIAACARHHPQEVLAHLTLHRDRTSLVAPHLPALRDLVREHSTK